MRNVWRIGFALAALMSMLVVVGPAAGAEATRDIRGKITRGGEPVAGVAVSLVDIDDNSRFRETCTNAKGRYKFKDVTVGHEHHLGTGVRLSKPTGVEGKAKCSNWKFEAPSGKDWLRYTHPDSHGVWGGDAVTYVVPAGITELKINIKLRGAKNVCAGYKATKTGTSGDDVLVGTSGWDVLKGKGGKDEISGKAGFDLICGDAGNDVLRGGADADFLFGGGGSKDRMIGGGDHDLCWDSAYKRADCETVLP